MSTNVELARAWIRAIDEHDDGTALLTPDFEMVESSTLPGAAHTRGIEELDRYIAGWRRNWSDWGMREVEIIDIPPSHVVVVADLRLRGQQSGIDVERRWVYLFSVRDGRLESQIGFDDKAEALRAAR